MDAKTVVRFLSKAIWQTSRYGFATGVTALALAILPLVLWLIIAVITGIIATALAFILFISGITASADPPIMALVLAVLLPIGYILALIVTLVGIIASVLLFTVLIILPTSFLVEITLHYQPSHRVLMQVVRFGFAGFIVSFIVNTLWLAFNLGTNWIIVALVMGLIMLVCVLATSLFGFTLIMTDKLRAYLSVSVTRLLNRATRAKQIEA